MKCLLEEARHRGIAIGFPRRTPAFLHPIHAESVSCAALWHIAFALEETRGPV